MAPTDKEKLAKQAQSSDDAEVTEAKAAYKKEHNSWKNWFSNAAVGAASAAIFTFFSKSSGELPVPSNAFQTCLNTVCNGAADCVRYPNTGKDSGDFFAWSRPYNRAYPVVPVAVVRPQDAKDVSGFVQCAAQNGVKVQARAGGHSFANFGLGGENGQLAIDLQNLRYVIIDKTPKTGKAEKVHARIGSGSLLGNIDGLMSKENRIFPHGVCPGVGIGGHATIGGLGPLSRMHGATLDNVLEAQVVIANGSIVRASEKENPDLFFAIRGAGASFGIVTEFVMQTYERPKDTQYYINRIPYKKSNEIVDQFLAYQELVADPNLDRRFACEFTLNKRGSKMTVTWYGTEDEFKKSGIQSRLPGRLTLVASSLVEVLRRQADNAELVLGDIPTEFYSRSLGLTARDKLSRNATEYLLNTIKENEELAAWKWFVIFDATGGMVAEPRMDSTAYAHRDKVMFYQSYSFNRVDELTEPELGFLRKIHEVILESIPAGQHTTYPGYVDMALGTKGDEAQKIYWGSNLPRLQQIKTDWDPKDVFHNPQSVRPL